MMKKAEIEKAKEILKRLSGRVQLHIDVNAKVAGEYDAAKDEDMSAHCGGAIFGYLDALVDLKLIEAGDEYMILWNYFNHKRHAAERNARRKAQKKSA